MKKLNADKGQIKKNGLTACNGCFDKRIFRMSRDYTDYPTAPQYPWSCSVYARKGAAGASRWTYEYWVSMAARRSYDICYDCISHPCNHLSPAILSLLFLSFSNRLSRSFIISSNAFLPKATSPTMSIGSFSIPFRFFFLSSHSSCLLFFSSSTR